ncbi:hypothetical protein ACIRBX_05195 [Kitasatospora sp. NPDC096147]|uniref:hypothetical protein n=1 Tax=Kitasatospora sp. NPDC096147 TaxID=3364093 RepID=UPI00381DDF89
MGIELELHCDRPPTTWDASRGTLLHSSYEHGDRLAEALALLQSREPGRLPRVDPYGDTVFDGQEAESALAEIPGLLDRCAGPGQEAAVRDLAAMLRLCAATPGSHLWFMGD